MSCERHRPAIRAVALGEPVAPDLEQHLAVCPSCARLVENDRRLVGRIESGIDELLAVEASPGFVGRVRARLEEPEPSASAWAWASRGWLPVALGAGALLVAVSLVGRGPSRLASTAGTVASVPPVIAPSPAIAPEPERTMPLAAVSAPPSAIASHAGSVQRAVPQSRPIAPPRVAPEVLIPAGDGAAIRRFLASRRHWRLAAESPSPEEFETLDLDAPSVADWEMDTSEGPVVFNWELDAWPLAPGD